MSSRVPDLVIVGAQKAGSVFVQECLRQHPQIWFSAGEDHFFRDPHYHDPRHDRGAFERFARPYARRGERRIGMKCPDYLGRPEVPGRLARDLSNPDLIVCLRDPVQRAVSAYFWWMRWGMIPIQPVEIGLSAILEGSHFAPAAVTAPILEYGRYHEHLQRYLKHFQREKMLVLIDDELRRRPARTLQRAHEFLGVDPEPTPAASKDNTGVYASERLRFLNLRNRYMLSWEESGTMATLRKPLNPGSRLLCNAVAAVDRYVLAPVYGNAKPTLSAELTARLYHHYRDDVAHLEDLLDRDLTAWRPTCASR